MRGAATDAKNVASERYAFQIQSVYPRQYEYAAGATSTEIFKNAPEAATRLFNPSPDPSPTPSPLTLAPTITLALAPAQALPLTLRYP